MREEPVSIPVDNQITLEGGYSRAAQPWGQALVLHPHPLYGGNMHNNVVLALVEAALAADLSALRINFRGVGRSGGRHEDGVGEVADVIAAGDWLQQTGPGPLVLMGYSFGSLVGAKAAEKLDNLAGGVWVSPPLVLGDLPPWPEGAGPLLMACGDRDEFTKLDRLQRYDDALGARSSLQLQPGGDHFWWGGESALNEWVGDYIRQLAGDLSPGS